MTISTQSELEAWLDQPASLPPTVRLRELVTNYGHEINDLRAENLHLQFRIRELETQMCSTRETA